MGGHEHGHEPPYKIPDHRLYSSIEGIKELEELQKVLALRGLRDPWIRNEIWRYHPAFGTKLSRFRMTVFRGFGVGVALTALHLGFNTVFGKDDEHGHGHGDGHADSH